MILRAYVVGTLLALSLPLGCDTPPGSFSSLLANRSTGGLCTNTCQYENDGDCDDGGPGSDYSACSLGTDCGDCGPRDTETDDPIWVENGTCSDACVSAGDGVCQDGRAGASYSSCTAGTDCSDCGPWGADSTEPTCEDSCSGYTNNGQCDDGSPSASTEYCALGTDCSDCDSNTVDPDAGCTDDCYYAGNGQCDDGSSNSVTGYCSPGTDCSDCENATDICNDDCDFAGDGYCQDGGAGALADVCAYGSDCSDCDSRTAGGQLSENSCGAYNGVCEDGRSGAGSGCTFGTDQSDCQNFTSNYCSNDCEYAFDGECQDGRGLYTYCSLGSDCNDCGPTDDYYE